MVNEDQKKQINDVLRKSVQEISISESQHGILVQSYEAVGNFLAENDSLKPYHPEIHPQGSIRLGTAIKPVAEEDDMDIDLVCELINIPQTWTQMNLKEAVGDCFKNSPRYCRMLEEMDGGKRCWTLLYREGSANGYHMDILPAVVADNYGQLLKTFDYKNYGQLAISITDKTLPNYATSVNHDEWPHSNPFGYAKWFEERCRPMIMKAVCESVENAPKYSESHSVLQGVIKLLKRHRDLMFNGDENKPISIIITTLAARAYEGENNLYDALQGIVSRMPKFIEERMEKGKLVKYISNPTDDAENFADKWPNEPQKEQMFFKWLYAVQKTVDNIGRGGLMELKNSIETLCGKTPTKHVFESIGRDTKLMRDEGALHMGTTGILSGVGTKVAAHNFYGK